MCSEMRLTDDEFTRAIEQVRYSMQRLPTPQQIVEIGRRADMTRPGQQQPKRRTNPMTGTRSK